MKASCAHRLQIRHLVMSSSNSCCSASEATTPQHPPDKPRCQVTGTGDSGTSGWGEKQGAPTFLSWYPFSYSQRDCTKRCDEDRIFPLLTTLCINCTVSLCTSSTYSPGFCSTHRSRGTGHQREKRKRPPAPCSGFPLAPMFPACPFLWPPSCQAGHRLVCCHHPRC